MIKVSVTTIQNWEKGQMPSGKNVVSLYPNVETMLQEYCSEP